MPLPDKTPKRELFRRTPMIGPKLGPVQEHDNLYAARNDVGMYSCPAMFASIVRTLRAEGDVEPCFKSGASDYMVKVNGE